MSETARRRTYYSKRVLIDTQRILDPQFDDELLCITGPQIEMLRNLMQYLKRRSTFADDYHTQYYLVPTTAEWDDIQAIVADLEETLMGCTELTAALNSIAAQLACICQAMATATTQTAPLDEGYDGQNQYDDYISDVIEDEDPVPGGFGTWDAWRVAKCKGAQRLIDDIASATNEIGISLTTGILITFTLLNALLMLTVITAPISIVLQLVITLVAIGADYAYDDVVSWLLEHKQALVCEIYNSDTTSEAHARITAYINDEWDAGTSDNPTRRMFNYQTLSSIFDGAMRDYTVWEGDYTDTYCDSCEDLEEGVEFLWEWGPCPGDHFQDGGTCENSRLCFNGDIDVAHQSHIVTLDTIDNIELEIRYRSKFTGWTVGGLGIDMWDPGLQEWMPLAFLSANSYGTPGDLCTHVDDFEVSPTETGGLYRARLAGQPGQHDVSPYPLQVEYARVKYELLP